MDVTNVYDEFFHSEARLSTARDTGPGEAVRA